MGHSFKMPTTHNQYLNILSIKALPAYLQNYKIIPKDLLNNFSVIKNQDQDRKQFSNIFQLMKQHKNLDPQFLPIHNVQIQRCVASFLGLAICDALGASTEFMTFTKQGYSIIKQGFGDIETAIKNEMLDARAGKIGIWTDDCSMALCMADSLIISQYKFTPQHIRYLFILWILNGLNNGGRKQSIGLGGNIKISMQQFMDSPTNYCETGDRFNNGNGSLMRLAPIPILFHNNQEEAIKYSGLSSLTTHNGEEAQQCCKLLAKILVTLYKRKVQVSPKIAIEKACSQFSTKCKSVFYLSKSMQQPQEEYGRMSSMYGKIFKRFNKSVADRNWNWKSKQFSYSQTRFEDKPGYVGSYCMDALAMALHTVWHTNSFKQAALVNANMGGDCDTVGAIAGQIAGAMYGIDKQMLGLYSQMQDFKQGRYQIFLKAFKLSRAL